jgi:hypothetical protein
MRKPAIPQVHFRLPDGTKVILGPKAPAILVAITAIFMLRSSYPANGKILAFIITILLAVAAIIAGFRHDANLFVSLVAAVKRALLYSSVK